MVAAKSPEFEQAIADSRKLTAKPTNDELLELYGLFREGSQDPPIAEAETPGTFDLKGKAKRKEWQKIHDSGVTPEEAQAKYVKLVEELKERYGFDETAA